MKVTPHDGHASIQSDLAGDLICFSHLRWHFVFQRPQHILSRFARQMRVFFWEEPVFRAVPAPGLEAEDVAPGVRVLRPVLPEGLHGAAAEQAEAKLLDAMVRQQDVTDPVLWYYTPMALGFSAKLPRCLTVYDCMDELSLFAGAPALLREREQQLLGQADLVFTGGHSLFEAKRQQHPDTHLFPSSVDVAHFAPARNEMPEPADQAGIPHPRIGFYGVLDERLDLALLDGLAVARPDWHLVLVGPLAKLDQAALPQRPNIHYIGAKPYAELPATVSSWDLSTIPFARCDATRYVSPTKTPEYLAAGLPVLSTPVADVVRSYGGLHGVGIAGTVADMVREGERLLRLRADPGAWRDEADAVLAGMSWDRTFEGMHGLMAERLARARRRAARRLLVGGVPRAGGRSDMPHFDVLVVGAGFAGSVLAERLATGSNKRVLLIDRRPHLAGNAYDERDAAGVLIHRYGPHIFHTNSQQVATYLSRFTEWRPYEHRVLARVGGALLPVPINRTTINRFFGVDLRPEEVDAFLATKAEPAAEIRTSEDVVVSRVGRELYQAFFQGYTRKQWGIDPSGLDKSVTARVPTRTSDDDRYFGDSFQAMPLHGYTRMFERMVDHPNITLALGTDYRDVARDVRYDHLVYTGPVDEFFDHRFGPLPYRSLRFEHRTLGCEQALPVAVVNEPSPDVPYTRTTEYKHLTGQVHPRTSITVEYPSAEGDPYYPIPRAENAALYARYRDLADALPDVSFVGRLATYKYYNMDQVVGQALATYARLSEGREAGGSPALPHRAAAEAAFSPSR